MFVFGVCIYIYIKNVEETLLFDSIILNEIKRVILKNLILFQLLFFLLMNVMIFRLINGTCNTLNYSDVLSFTTFCGFHGQRGWNSCWMVRTPSF